MSQDIYSSIDPATTSGTQLAELLVDFKDAIVSGLSGTTRPTNLQAGGYWIDTSQAGLSDYWSYKIYDGTDDIEVFRLNLTSNTASITGTTNQFAVSRFSADAAGPIAQLIKRRIATNGQVLAGDTIGDIQFIGRANDSSNPVVASIMVTALENETAAASGGTMVFQTTSTGSAVLSEVMRIRDGKVSIGGVVTPSVALHVQSPTGIMSERRADDVLGAQIKLKKSRITGSGAIQLADTLGQLEMLTTDSLGAEAVVAKIDSVASEAHTGAARGTKIRFLTTKIGAASPVSFLEVGEVIEAVEPLLQNASRLVSQDVASAASLVSLSAAKAVVRITGTTASILHGIVATGATRVIVLHNASTVNLTLTSQSATETTAVNRLLLSQGTIIVKPNDSIELFYDETALRWKLRSAIITSATTQADIDAKIPKSILTGVGGLITASGAATPVQITGTVGQVPTVQADLSIAFAPQAAAPPTIFPWQTNYTSGSGTHFLTYYFVTTSGNATAGAVYTHNGFNFTVVRTMTAGTRLYASGTGAPLTAGTLTKSSGTGDATLTFSASYAPKRLVVEVIGGGGGGAGSGSAGGSFGGTGGTTSFGTGPLLSAVGGQGGQGLNQGGLGGSFTINAGLMEKFAFNGGGGGSSTQQSGAGILTSSGSGGNSMFGGGAGSIYSTNVGGGGSANTGGGGSGGGMNNGVSGFPGAGGGAGGYGKGAITNDTALWALSHPYTCGLAGAAGAAGASGQVGGAGSNGFIIVAETY